MNPLPPLTPQQDHVLALISAGSTISEAAQSVGVHRNTVHNWIRSPHFRLAFAHARESKALFWREESERLAAEAIDTIHSLMTDASTPAGTRLKAAQFILSLATTPPAQPTPLLDLFQPPLAAGQQPPIPQTVHNSAQSAPAPQAAPTPTARRSSPRIGRNHSCPCGSGKKFKRCCLQSGGAALGDVA